MESRQSECLLAQPNPNPPLIHLGSLERLESAFLKLLMVRHPIHNAKQPRLL